MQYKNFIMRILFLVTVIVIGSLLVFQPNSIGKGKNLVKKAPAPVAQTGQSICYDEDGYQIDCCYDDYGNPIDCTGTGQDGDHQAGVLWPVPRFTDNLNGTVTDNLTGLIWLKNANCPNGGKHWSDAITFANSLYDGWTGDPIGGDCGLNDGSVAGDWRLPNIKELLSLFHYGVSHPVLSDTTGTGQWSEGDPFIGVKWDWPDSNYWVSTGCIDDTGDALGVDVGYGNVDDFDKNGIFFFYVWPVRGGK